VKDVDAADIIHLGMGDVELLKALNRMFGEAFEDPGSYAATCPATTV
jgi:hypothetical protein